MLRRDGPPDASATTPAPSKPSGPPATPATPATAAPGTSAAPGIPAGRLHGLSDGVFAIVMTLLVLELQVPALGRGLSAAASSQAVTSALLALAPKLGVYVFTFLVAGLSWLAHSQFYAHVGAADRRLGLLNVLYLMCVSLLPFSAGLIGAYGGFAIATAAYAVNQVLISAAFLWMVRYADARRDGSLVSAQSLFGPRSLVNLVVFALMAVLAFISLPLSWATPFALLVAQPLVGRWRSRHPVTSP